MSVLQYCKRTYLNSTLSKKIILLIALFVTVVPVIVISVLGVAYYKVGIEALFDEQISRSISQTVEVAEKYFDEHRDNIKSDVLALANDLDRNASILYEDPEIFRIFLDKQSELRNLPEIIVFQVDRLIARNTFAFTFAFEKLPESVLPQVDSGEVIILGGADKDKVKAILRIGGAVPTYLMVGRYVDPAILDYLHDTQGSAEQYNKMRSELEYTKRKLIGIFTLLLLVSSILSLLAARALAIFITMPLNDLVSATARIRSGDFAYQLPEKEGKDETAVLTRSFNVMTNTLAKQRAELIRFNEVIDERRQFIEKTLAGISAGVVAVDAMNKIILMNASAHSLLNIQEVEQDQKIDDIFPEVIELIEAAKKQKDEITSGQVEVISDGEVFHFLVRIGILMQDRDIIRHIIITVDDITGLIAAQRSSAWADVARRIAHEIKNPLTPIALATERIKTKYGTQIINDKENFDRYVGMISKYVGDIGNMVEEFVQFARIPMPKMKNCNLYKLIKEIVFAQKLENANVNYDIIGSQDTEVCCDSGQISQVILNALKNSVESIMQKVELLGEGYKGAILIRIENKMKNFIEVQICDNGIGIEPEILGSIFDPYVTTKGRGTGLGLAIMKKIIEEHGGTISIKPLKDGAELKFIIPKHQGVKNE